MTASRLRASKLSSVQWMLRRRPRSFCRRRLLVVAAVACPKNDPASRQGALQICHNPALRRVRSDAKRSAPHSLCTAARAWPQGQRRIHGRRLPPPSPESPQLWRRILVVGCGQHRPSSYCTRAVAAVTLEHVRCNRRNQFGAHGRKPVRCDGVRPRATKKPCRGRGGRPRGDLAQLPQRAFRLT